MTGPLRPFAECRFMIQLSDRAPGGAWCQCATHGGSGPARCGAVASLLEKRLLEASITAGGPGEQELSRAVVGPFIVKRLPEDPLALRISIGQPHAAEGAYLVYRGEPAANLALLERALAALRLVL